MVILDRIWTVFAELETEQPKKMQPVQSACYPRLPQTSREGGGGGGGG